MSIMSIMSIVYGDSESHALIRARCMAYIEAEQWYFQSFIAEPFIDYVTRLKVSRNHCSNPFQCDDGTYSSV
jgi:hypothetical protein